MTKRLSIIAIVFCCCALSHSIYADWVKASNGLFERNFNFGAVTSFSSCGSNIALSSSSGIFISIDSGVSWKLIKTCDAKMLLNTGTDLIAALEMRAHPLYTGQIIIGDGIISSNDCGATWKTLLKTVNEGSQCRYSERIFSMCDICQNRINSAITRVNNTLYCKSTYENRDFNQYHTYYTYVIYSIDNGVNWQSVGNFMVNAQVNMLASQDAFLFAARDSGVFRMKENDTMWTPMLLNKKAITLICDSKLYVSTNDGNVYSSADYGVTWNQEGAGLPNVKINSLVRSGTNLLAGTEGQGVFVLVDGESAWKSIGLTDKSISAFKTFGSCLLVGTKSGDVYRTTDNGITWKPSYWTDSNCSITGITISGSFLLAQSTNDVFISKDNGTTWEITSQSIQTDTSNNYLMKRASDSLATAVYALCKEGKTLFAGTGGGGVYRSPDSGYTWNYVRNTLPSTNVNALVILDTMVFVGLNGSGVWKRSINEMKAFNAPVQTSPLNNTKQPLSVDLKWTPVNGAKTYQLYSTHISSNGADTINTDTIKNPIYTMNLNVDGFNSEPYYWKVRALGNNERTSWSATWKFYQKHEAICGPTSNCIVSPLNGDTVKADTAIFSWAYCPLTWNYRIKIAKDSLMDSIIKIDSTIKASGGLTISKKYGDLDTSRVYWWRVDACTNDTCVNCGGNQKFYVATKTSLKAKLFKISRKIFEMNNTSIKYFLSEEMPISLKMFDYRGRLVFINVKNNQTPGLYIIQFSKTNLPHGCYVLCFQAGKVHIQQKCVITQ